MGGEGLRGMIQEQRKKIMDSRLPLRNIRVIDLVSIVAALLLSDFGAEVRYTRISSAIPSKRYRRLGRRG